MHCCTIHALYRSKLWQQDHCQHPQNVNPDGSTLESTAQFIGRLFGGGGTEGHRQEDPDQGVHRKGPGNYWRNSPAAYSADYQRFRRLTHNCECMCEQPDLTEKTKNHRLIKSVRPHSCPDLYPLDYFVWSYVENITNMTYHYSKASLIVANRRAPAGAFGKGMLPVLDLYQGGDWGWRWLHCQLYYIINLPEWIFSLKVLK